MDPLEDPTSKARMPIIASIKDEHSIKDIMKSEWIPDFQAPPIPKCLDTSEAIDELRLYNSFEQVPYGFLTPLPLWQNEVSVACHPFFAG